MDINRLLSDELSWELLSRGCEVGNKTVEQKRILLRQLLRNDFSNAKSVATFHFDPVLELTVCSSKLEELLGYLEEFNLENRENEYRKIKTRLLHVEARLDRVEVKDEKHLGDKINMLELCRELIKKLEEIYIESKSNQNEFSNSSLLDIPNEFLSDVLQNQDSSNSDIQRNELKKMKVANDLIDIGETNNSKANCDDLRQIENIHISSNHLSDRVKNLNLKRNVEQNGTNCRLISENKFRPVSFTSPELPDFSQNHKLDKLETNMSNKYVDVSRWRLKFDSTTSVTDFLETLEEMRISRGVSEQQMLNSVSELLEGDVSIWYRFARNKIFSYREFCNTLRSTFLPRNYEDKILEILRHRTQGTGESVVIYIAHMEGLYTKLQNKPPEFSRVNFIKNKMLPHIQLGLAGKIICTVDKLIEAGREIEEAHASAQVYQPPPVNPRNSVEPGLEYRHPQRKSTSFTPVNVLNVSSNQNSENLSSSKETRQFICWNCGKPGHLRKNCLASPRKVCYRCGTAGVTVRTCQKCSGNGSSSH